MVYNGVNVFLNDMRRYYLLTMTEKFFASIVKNTSERNDKPNE
jgi:hypothetical protein